MLDCSRGFREEEDIRAKGKKSLVNVLSFLVKFTMWEKGQIKRVVREIGED